jgi:chloramphenicol 3-O-phosphotransferase
LHFSWLRRARAITHRSREVARDGVNFASTVHRNLIDRPKMSGMASARHSSRRGRNLAGVTILSGPIGAGKTAVSKELIALWSGPLAYIEGDQFWPFLVKRTEGDRREDFPVIMRAMTSAAGSFVRTGYDVLLDFSIPPAFLPTAQKILRDAPLHYIVLRPPLEVCSARARDRAEGKIAKYDRGFYAMFAADPRHVIAPDDSESPKAIAEIIVEGLAEGRFRVAPTASAPPS